ncbi:hypothetical protein ADICYQ_0139 [Cyclobacterium qasimii M12-11B]|uniref:Uncharacterized protein n=1 Tax=Cyclobacterium qasimii M12-11B TaxID=641524 RepID=S7X6J9_9BACT|nr:hypothetical protein ADICYQ_0139 [Cyclobacterium qasimii M12-11B]
MIPSPANTRELLSSMIDHLLSSYLSNDLPLRKILGITK